MIRFKAMAVAAALALLAACGGAEEGTDAAGEAEAPAEALEGMAGMPGMAGMQDGMMQMIQRMNMAGDSAWTATADSVRQDLTRMPGMSAQEFGEFMPAHRERMTRLMEMHRSMTGNTGM